MMVICRVIRMDTASVLL